jgi:hypothetical protein
MCGAQICPVEIKLLGVLRMLGRNWCADDVAEATGMGESTVRTAFNSFRDNFVTEFYETVVYILYVDKYFSKPVGRTELIARFVVGYIIDVTFVGVVT